jgi:hypothetical protein
VVVTNNIFHSDFFFDVETKGVVKTHQNYHNASLLSKIFSFKVEETKPSIWNVVV